MGSTDFDAIVVGSGSSGGWAAKELTELGLTTLVLEAGRPITPEKDYVEHVPPWEMPFRGLTDRQRVLREQPIQSQVCGDELALRFFVNDVDNPYSTNESEPFVWIRGRQVGGRSITWERNAFRVSNLEFEEPARAGYGVDWPIRYGDLEPWYDRVEDFIGVSGQAEGLPHFPDGRFLPPFPLRPPELAVKERMAARYGRDRMLTHPRVAVLTRAHRGREACHRCGPCERGCITASYFNSVHSTLPAAAATGRLTLRADSVVHSLMFDASRRLVTGVRVIDAHSKAPLEFRARVVFLCASALESTRILLNSATPAFPSGLANSSGTLGRYLMDHVTSGAGCELDYEGPDPYPHRPAAACVPRFVNVREKHPDFVGGFFLLGQAKPSEPSLRKGFGVDLKKHLKDRGPWRWEFLGLGDYLPDRNNYVELDKNKLDAWGIPTLRIHCKVGPNELRLRKAIAEYAAEILSAAGGRKVESYVEDTPPGIAVHEMGTARMGRDPRTSVLNAYCRTHDVKNLFVTDGAAMTSSATVNPGLTYMALTARAANHAVEQLKRGEI